MIIGIVVSIEPQGHSDGPQSLLALQNISKTAPPTTAFRNLQLELVRIDFKLLMNSRIIESGIKILE
jgi:hypothetical protein